jgi:hypothetical protein
MSKESYDDVFNDAAIEEAQNLLDAYDELMTPEQIREELTPSKDYCELVAQHLERLMEERDELDEEIASRGGKFL